MPKAAKTVDDVNEPIENDPAAPVGYSGGKTELWRTPELTALEASGIITIAGTKITWREGHLEHIAAQYKADPVRCERVYHDDVTVARMYSQERWEALING